MTNDVGAVPLNFPNAAVNPPAVTNSWGRPSEVYTIPQIVPSAVGIHSDQATSLNVPGVTGFSGGLGRLTEVNVVPQLGPPTGDSFTAPNASVKIGSVGTVRAGEGLSPASVNSPVSLETNNEKQFRPNIKLPNFNGNTSLETFLVKFENVARYLKWNEADRLFYICSCLDGGSVFVGCG